MSPKRVVVLLFVTIPLWSGEPRVEGSRLVFRAVDLAGQTVTQDDPRFEGKVLLVGFWGTWCAPCLSEIPTLVDLQLRYREQGLVVVALAFEKIDDEMERHEPLQRIVQRHQINYLVLDGGSTSVFSQAVPNVDGIDGLPVEILINRQGAVMTARHGTGYRKRWAKELEREILELLAEPPLNGP